MILAAVLALPLAAAAVCSAVRRRAVMEAANLAAAAVLFALSVALAAEVLRSGPVSLWGGFLYADHLSALVLLLTAAVTLLCLVYSVGYLRAEDRAASSGGEGRPPNWYRRYYTLTPLFAFAMLLVLLANNLGVMWVAVEGTTLASVFLVTFHERSTSLEAAWKYVMIGSVGLSMALFGTILTYYSARRVLGAESIESLNWSVLAGNAHEFDANVMRLAFILILLGYGTKAGIAPMHTWKPDAYSEAPVPIAALLAAAALNCAVYALARYHVLAAGCLGTEFTSRLLVLFGLLSIAVAVPFVLVQRSFRRLLAYSSIDHGGIMLLGLGFGGPLGALGSLLHMIFHSLTKPVLFFCAGNIQQGLGTDLFRKARGGVIHSMPVSGAVFLVSALAVTGSPPFGIFQSELTILRAASDGRQVLPAVLAVGFLVAIFAGMLVHVSSLVLGPPSDAPPAPTSPWQHAPIVALALAILVLGFWLPAPLYELTLQAARILMVN